MTFVELLKSYNARLSLGNSWLVWDEKEEEWLIYRQKHGERVKQFDSTFDEELAVKMLLEADGQEL